jgi:hypothetical protein
MTMAHQSRWGWYPCDYETFLCLKKLNARCLKALRGFAAWRRWQRKMPHNRVLRETILDDQGCKAGSRVVGPRPEPPLDPLFCTRHPVTRYHGPGTPAGERVCFSDLGIPRAYGSARRPVAAEALVRPLELSRDEIRRLAGRAEEC